MSGRNKYRSDTFGRNLLVVVILLISVQPPASSAIAASSDVPTQLEVSPENAVHAANITSISLSHANQTLKRMYTESITQYDFSKHLETIMRAEGADNALALYTRVLSGSELFFVKGIPDTDQDHVIDPFTEPIVVIEMGCKYRNHSSDVTRTFFFDSASQEMLDAYTAVLEAQEILIAAISPGALISDLDDIIREELADYIEREDVTFRSSWGHGIGFFVEEAPNLSHSATESLEAGQVLVIEPALYFYDGWSVRLGDVIQVTESGCEVLSTAPRDLESCMVHQDDHLTKANIIEFEHWYGHDCEIGINIKDSLNRSIDHIDFHDGYSWYPMTQQNETRFTRTYLVDYDYSGRYQSTFRVHLPEEVVYFTRELWANPRTSFDVDLPADVDFYPVQIPGFIFNTPLRWIFTQRGAELIRVEFSSLITTYGDLFLILDGKGRFVTDYRSFYKINQRTPWVSGDTVIIEIIPVEPGEERILDDLYFMARNIEIVGEQEGDPIVTQPIVTQTTPDSSPIPLIEIDLEAVAIIGVSVFAVALAAFIILDMRKS